MCMYLDLCMYCMDETYLYPYHLMILMSKVQNKLGVVI
jgi:hypothetical protein